MQNLFTFSPNVGLGMNGPPPAALTRPGGGLSNTSQTSSNASLHQYHPPVKTVVTAEISVHMRFAPQPITDTHDIPLANADDTPEKWHVPAEALHAGEMLYKLDARSKEYITANVSIDAETEEKYDGSNLSRKRSFQFNRCFSEQDNQDVLYGTLMQPLVADVVHGKR